MILMFRNLTYILSFEKTFILYFPIIDKHEKFYLVFTILSKENYLFSMAYILFVFRQFEKRRIR